MTPTEPPSEPAKERFTPAATSTVTFAVARVMSFSMMAVFVTMMLLVRVKALPRRSNMPPGAMELMKRIWFKMRFEMLFVFTISFVFEPEKLIVSPLAGIPAPPQLAVVPITIGPAATRPG